MNTVYTETTEATTEATTEVIDLVSSASNPDTYRCMDFLTLNERAEALQQDSDNLLEKSFNSNCIDDFLDSI